jgi:hypothetical protein
MEKRKREAFLEDLLAATSPEYLKSIREARADYEAKRVKTHEEVFVKRSLRVAHLQMSMKLKSQVQFSK